MHKQSSQICPCLHSLIEQEYQQQKTTTSFINDRSLKSPTHLNSPSSPIRHKHNKPVYSFKNQKPYLSPLHQTRKANSGIQNVKQIPKIVFSHSQSNNSQRYVSPIHFNAANTVTLTKMLSPRVNDFKEVRSPSFKTQYQSNTTVRPQTPQLRMQTGKMQGKRIRTAEEQTQYSSKHSQIFFKNPNQFIQNGFQNKNVFNKKPKNILFQDELQSQNSIAQQFSSCQEVSAHEQVDTSLSNDFLQNARTIQTIMTSTELQSKLHSRDPSNVFTFAKCVQSPISICSPRKSSAFNFGPALKNHPHQMSSFKRQHQQTPRNNTKYVDFHKINTSPCHLIQQVPQKMNSDFFYSQEVSQKIAKSPKVSVLDIEDNENSFQEQLRDKIDHNFLISLNCSRANSPLISLNNSKKNIEQKSQRRIVNFNLSEQGNSNNNSELVLLTQIRAKTKRTNTIESLCSSVSQKSQLDIKFMQKFRTRREVSKLI